MLSFKTLIVAVAVSLATAATKLQGANLNGKTKPGSLEACIGECDHDKDCKAGLKCFQRQNGEKIPGCVGKGSGKDWDYCYKPKKKAKNVLQGANLNGKTKPGSLEACIGECDHDKDCKAGLKCFQRQNGEKIPGCVGKGSGKDWDYCYDPNPKPDSEIKITPKGGPTCADGENGGFSCPVGTSTLTGQMASTKCKASGCTHTADFASGASTCCKFINPTMTTCSDVVIVKNKNIDVAPKMGGYSQNQCGTPTTWTSIPAGVTKITLRVKCREGGCNAKLKSIAFDIFESDQSTPLQGASPAGDAYGNPSLDACNANYKDQSVWQDYSVNSVNTIIYDVSSSSARERKLRSRGDHCNGNCANMYIADAWAWIELTAHKCVTVAAPQCNPKNCKDWECKQWCECYKDGVNYGDQCAEDGDPCDCSS